MPGQKGGSSHSEATAPLGSIQNLDSCSGGQRPPGFDSAGQKCRNHMPSVGSHPSQCCRVPHSLPQCTPTPGVLCRKASGPWLCKAQEIILTSSSQGFSLWSSKMSKPRIDPATIGPCSLSVKKSGRRYFPSARVRLTRRKYAKLASVPLTCVNSPWLILQLGCSPNIIWHFQQVWEGVGG